MRKRPISILISAAILLLAVNACKKTRKEVTGCKDTAAYNYDSTATINAGCKYHIDNVVGAYNVHDTVVRFQHDMTTAWYDTAYSTFTINAIAYGHDSLEFDTVLCISCSGGYRFVASDFSSFYTRFDNYPVLVSQDGRFSGDTLRYSAGTSPMAISGGYKRSGLGLKVR